MCVIANPQFRRYEHYPQLQTFLGSACRLKGGLGRVAQTVQPLPRNNEVNDWCDLHYDCSQGVHSLIPGCYGLAIVRFCPRGMPPCAELAQCRTRDSHKHSAAPAPR